jgi:glyoxylase-like metal-dependent hydrolase (beta-lactamase superfamily II)
MKIANNVEMLEISAEVMGRPAVVHPTLAWDEDNLILFDAGFPGQLALIQAAIDKAGQRFTRLNRVIVTHHDIDHIGSLKSILATVQGRGKQGRLQVLASAQEKDFIEGTQPALKLAQMQSKLDSLSPENRIFYEKMRAAFQNATVGVDQTLADGEKLPWCGGITVIETPGHTLGHICLYLQESKTLVAGDALAVENGALVLSPASMNYDMGMARQSLKKLAGYDIQKVISYHGGLVEGRVGSQIAALTRR